MKIPIGPLRTAILSLAGALVTSLSAEAVLVPNPQPGDIFLGFRASGGEGASVSYLINLGPDTQFRNATPGSSFILGDLGNIAADLVALFSSEDLDWFEREDLHWGIFGTRKSASSSVYGSKERLDINTPGTPWIALSTTQRNGTANEIIAVVEGLNGYKGRSATANSPVATIQNNFPGEASYNFQVGTTGTTDFGSLSQWTSIEGDFGDGTAGTVLDLFRLASSSGVDTSTWIGSFSISDTGVITFTAVPEPSVYAFLAVAATIAVVLRHRRSHKA